MRVLFAGTPEVAVPCLDAVIDGGHDVVGVLTRPPAPVGRKRTLTPSPVHAAAVQRGIDVITSTRPDDPDILEQIAATGAQGAAVVAYGALLRQGALQALPHGWINLHFSLLPAWRGAAPVQYAIRAGDTRTGASVFQIEKGLDTGPVFASAAQPIRPWHTSGDLLAELTEIGGPLLSTVLHDIDAGTAAAVPQGSDGVSLAPTLTSADARIDWSAPAAQIDQLVRAMTPAPGAWTTLDGKRAKIGPVRLTPDAPPLQPGELAVVTDGVLVGTGTDPVALGDIAPPGKGWMAASDWGRGARLDHTSRFGATDG